MKLKVFVAALMLSVFGLTACNDDQTELGVNYDKTAEVKGYVSLRSTNKQGNTIYESAKSLRVFALVSYADLTGDQNAEGEQRFETTTDNKGNYSFNIPATDNGISIKVFTDRIDGTSYIGSEVKEGYFETSEETVLIKAGIFSVCDMTLTFHERTELNRD